MHSVFIVGGSGKVARSLARQLADRGHQPHSLYRHAEQAEGLEALGAIPVAGNLLDLDTEALAKLMAGMPGGSYGFLAVSIVAFIILGSVLEGIPAIVLFGPLLFPIAVQAGVHEVHYAMVVIFAMGIGLFAPPFGVGYYGACAISRVDPNEGIRPIWGYIGALLIGLIVVAAFPWFSIGFL